MQQLTNQDVQDFINLLVTFGGLNHLNKDMVIVDENEEPQVVKDGDKLKSIQILHPGMIKDENNYILNPLKTIEGNNPAMTWFYSTRVAILSDTIKLIVLKVAELCASKETSNYDILQLTDNVSELCDSQTKDELAKINGGDYFRIYYNKKSRIAEAQTALFDDEMESRYKMRKKTWTAVRQLIRNIFKLKKDEYTLSEYKYHSTIINIPEIDAKLHCISKVIDVIDPWAKLIGIEFPCDELRRHLENLESYARMYAWFTAKSTQDKIVVNNNSPQNLPIRNDVKPVISNTQDLSKNDNSIPVIPAVQTPVAPVPQSMYGINQMPQQQLNVVNPYPQVCQPMYAQPYGVPMQQQMMPPGYGYPMQQYQVVQPVVAQLPSYPPNMQTGVMPPPMQPQYNQYGMMPQQQFAPVHPQGNIQLPIASNSFEPVNQSNKPVIKVNF